MAAVLTIITPTTSKALTTFQAVQQEIGSEVPDRLVAQFILRASATIETICGRAFARERVRETSPSVMRPGGSFVLTRLPIVEIHSVTSDGRPLGTGAYNLDHGVLTGAHGRVVVEYTGGYVLPGNEGADLPADIERAAIMLVKQDFHLRDRDLSIRSEGVDGVGSTTYFPASALFDAEAALSRYREPVVL